MADAPASGLLPRVDRDSPVPLHLQVRGALVALVERGEPGGGRPLPPERVLAAELGVSLAPVRQALLDLAREGVLYRVRGKGTFVREHAFAPHDRLSLSFSESVRASGFDVTMTMLRKRTVAARREVAEELATTGRVWAIERRAEVERVPVALISSWLPVARFPGLGAAVARESSLYALIEQRYGVRPARAATTVEVGRCSTVQASQLGLAPGAPVLVARGVAYDVDDRPVERFHVLYRADRVRLHLEARLYAENVIRDGSPATRHGATARGEAGGKEHQ